MKKLTNFLIEKRIYILIITVILLALSVVGFVNTGVNSDVTSYLPKNTMTSVGKEKLAEIFNIKGDANIGVSNIRKEDLAVMIDHISESYTYLDQNGDKKNIFNKIAWLGSFDPLKDKIDATPGNDITKEKLQESYNRAYNKFYKETSDTYVVFMYLSIPNTDDAAMDMLSDLGDYLTKAGEEYSAIYENADSNASPVEYLIGGSAKNAKDLLESSIGEIPKYLIIAVILISIVLLFTTKSFIEPIIFLMTLGISIVLNLGSNIILGEISSITLSSSTILQLALAMDFSIFLMHTYYEERKKTIDAKSALLIAVPKTLKAIAASALTTIGGFVALFSMEFGMGLDLGAVLAKGVLLSLVTVVILQPILIFMLEKKITRTQHRYFEPHIKNISNFSCKRRHWLITIAVIVAIPTFVIQLLFVPLSYLTITQPNPDPTKTETVIKKVNGQIIILAPYSVIKTKDPATGKDIMMKHRDPHYQFVNELKQIKTKGGPSPIVTEIFSLFTILDSATYLGAETSDPDSLKMLEDNFLQAVEYDPITKEPIEYYALYTVELDLPIEDARTYDVLAQIEVIGNKIFHKKDGEGGIYITGNSQGAKDLNAVTPTDFIKVSILSAAIIFVILLFSFKSFILSALLLFAIELGIFINLSLVAISGAPINFMSYIIISSIQLGATVDYAILYTSKYLESRKSMSVKDALRDAMYRGSPSILVSCAVLSLTCLSVFAVTSNVIVSEITMLTARGALLSTILVMTLLPGLIYAVYHKKDTIPDANYDILAIYKKEKIVPVVSANATESIDNVVKGMRAKQVNRIQDRTAAKEYKERQENQINQLDDELDALFNAVEQKEKDNENENENEEETK